MPVDPPGWNTFYLKLRGRLIDRPVSISEDGSFPEQPAEVMAAYDACKRLTQGDDLPALFKFLQKRIADAEARVKAATASEAELRASKARRETLEWFVAEIVDLLETQDRAALESAEKGRPGDTTKPPTP